MTPSEVKTLRGLLGSLQWLVAQVRFDIGFQVSTLQSAPHTVSTLLQANKAVVDAKKNGDFFLKFGHIPLKEGGVVVVSVAALGNVDNNGCISGEPSKKVFSQSCYIVLLGDQALLSGKQAVFQCWTTVLTAFHAWLAQATQLRRSVLRRVLMQASWLAASWQKRWAIQRTTRMGTSW